MQITPQYKDQAHLLLDILPIVAKRRWFVGEDILKILKTLP